MSTTHPLGSPRRPERPTVLAVPREPRQRRSAQSRQQLLDAATELLGSNGYDATTFVAIGQRAGVSRGLVSYHFASKEACIRETLESVRQTALAHLQERVGDAAGLSRIERTIEEYLRPEFFDSPERRAVFVAMLESISSHPELRDLTSEGDERFRSMWRSLIVAAIDAGEADPAVDADLAATAIVGAIRGVAMQSMVRPDAVDLDAATDAILVMVRALLGAR